MRIDVVGRGVDVTDAIREYAETKADKLTRYFNGTQFVEVHLEKADSHTFRVELVIDVEKHENFVCDAKHEDLYHTIDDAVHKGTRLLTDFKERLKNTKR
ncbi:MAG: ribosome-associated translation inhibitor RaiA [Planctomycetota bacterium]